MTLVEKFWNILVFTLESNYVPNNLKQIILVKRY